MKTKHYIQSLFKNAFLILFLFASVAEAQIVNIPDANLKAALVTASMDTQNLLAYNASGVMVPVDANSDGEIQYSEAALIVGLQLGGLEMLGLAFSDCTGLEAFVNLNVIDISNNPIGSIDTSIFPSALVALNCFNCGLTELDISALPNLVALGCSENALTSIDVSNRPTLSNFICDKNALTSLDLSGCPALEYVSCSNNLLPTVNLPDSPNLRYFYCMSNLFTTIDISGFPVLEELYCDSNQITNINFGSNTVLRKLYCRSNPISGNIDVSQFPNLQHFACRSTNQTAVDVSHNINLYFLDCAGNNLTAVDVSMLPNLTQFDCSLNPITTVDVSAQAQLNLLYCHHTDVETIFMKNGMAEDIMLNDNPNLRYVCADNNQADFLQSYLGSGVVVNTYCSFTPGGNYNTLSGTATFDQDNNGCDALDVHIPHVRFDINDGTNQGAAFTNDIGNYTFFTQAGDFTIQPAVENQAWFNFLPPTAGISFADVNHNSVTQDFCISANGLHPDLEIVIAPVLWARPGFEATYLVTYKNKGNQTLSGNITFTYDDSMLDFVSATVAPATQNTGLLNWNYSDLLPFESRSFYITLAVNAPTAIPPVNIGDQLDFEATITPVIGDEFPDDNLFTFHQTVVGSFDPNDITCIEGEVVPPSEIGNYLHYIINFENTGTFPAENIVVRTEVDATKFDIGSLQLLDTSDSLDARINGNTVEFIFKNIDLEIGGHGHILLKIKTQDNLVTGDAVAKRADIFFDYNAPVDTGFANTVFQTLSNTDFGTDASVVISPNPVHDELHVKADNRIESVTLFDAQGRIVMNQMLNEMETKSNVSQYQSGIYFAKIKTQKGIQVLKIQKD